MAEYRGLDSGIIQDQVRAALREDAAGNDVTSALLDLAGRRITAEIHCFSSGIIAGLDLAAAAFHVLDSNVAFDARIAEGERVEPRRTVAAVSGDAAAIMAAERTALNFMQRLSGIATITGDYVKRVAGSGVTILDTRKTTPQLRELEKYAVRVGGGSNHRGNLEEMVLIKENHIRSAGGIGAVMRTLGRRDAPVAVEVEIDSLELLKSFLGTPVARIMLDNFSPAEVETALDLLEQFRKDEPEYRPEVEISGGITLENIVHYALPGVDCISVGALTHSAPVLDLSLEVLKADGK